MKINKQNIHRIMDLAKTKFIEQPTHIYWFDRDKEIDYYDKRIIAILEAASIELKLELEVEYKVRK